MVKEAGMRFVWWFGAGSESNVYLWQVPSVFFCFFKICSLCVVKLFFFLRVWGCFWRRCHIWLKPSLTPWTISTCSDECAPWLCKLISPRWGYDNLHFGFQRLIALIDLRYACAWPWSCPLPFPLVVGRVGGGVWRVPASAPGKSLGLFLSGLPADCYKVTITIYFIHPSGKLKLLFDSTVKNISQ